ncbi:MAG TPA: hypothetical protein VHY58_22070 [Streptosporangiaceae bacterium]|nr:hypothetical protein [Streptosporangiaceae bacterium]
MVLYAACQIMAPVLASSASVVAGPVPPSTLVRNSLVPSVDRAIPAAPAASVHSVAPVAVR